jgi:chromosome segregation ATPase
LFQESNLLLSSQELEGLKSALLRERQSFFKQRQIAAMREVLSRPWRHDREILSAAMSKWARVAMFPTMQNTAHRLANETQKKQMHELEHERKSLERIREELRHREFQLNESRDALEKAKAHLRKDSVETFQKQLEKELSDVAVARGSLELERLELKKREESLKIQEGFVAAKEEEVMRQEQEVAKMNSKIREMASALQVKHREVELQQTRLHMEQYESETSQARLHRLALRLQRTTEEVAVDHQQQRTQAGTQESFERRLGT